MSSLIRSSNSTLFNKHFSLVSVIETFWL